MMSFEFKTTREGTLEILDLAQLQRRSNQTDDPRWIFYSAMLSSRSVAEYREFVGGMVVFPPTYRRRVSAENELRYAVYDRRWLAIRPDGASWPDAAFVPDPDRDERIKTLREIIQRQGQQRFRREMLEAYGAKCAISACPIVQLLDAAHITPYLGPHTNRVDNGILLRTDLHTLWDLAMLAVEPGTNKVKVAASLHSLDSRYRSVHNTFVRLPTARAFQPSRFALEAQWRDFCARESVGAPSQARLRRER